MSPLEKQVELASQFSTSGGHGSVSIRAPVMKDMLEVENKLLADASPGLEVENSLQSVEKSLCRVENKLEEVEKRSREVAL